ncbi:OPA3-like protein [Zea mays]|uniref:OPA3-like protein n=1 Tax=Zea mays TaxID=4577 RepID=A0A3L6DM07_MAIZE|nr:OPA3-like protein [Zea mays]
MVLPLVKLGSLAFRTLSKPIAARLKYNAGIHPKFRGLIIGIAQANHRFTTNMQRRLYGRATDIHIRPLNEEKAIQAAADLLGELFVFSASNIFSYFCNDSHIISQVAGAAIIYEVQRSARSEARKEEARRLEIEEIKKREEQLALEVQVMKHKISEMERQYSKWTLPGLRGFGTAQAAAQPAGTQHPTAA